MSTSDEKCRPLTAEEVMKLVTTKSPTGETEISQVAEFLDRGQPYMTPFGVLHCSVVDYTSPSGKDDQKGIFCTKCLKGSFSRAKTYTTHHTTSDHCDESGCPYIYEAEAEPDPRKPHCLLCDTHHVGGEMAEHCDCGVFWCHPKMHCSECDTVRFTAPCPKCCKTWCQKHACMHV